MHSILFYAVLVLAFAAIYWLVLWMDRPRGPRCDCGQPGAFLRSDGAWECEACTERRTG